MCEKTKPVDVDTIIDSFVNDVFKKLKWHPYGLNERYLHHWFSQKFSSGFDIEKGYTESIFHPEWPTYKKARDESDGKKKEEHGLYSKKAGEEKGIYIVNEALGYPGFIDFVVGKHDEQKIAIEFMLRYSWGKNEYKFNLEKLNDERNKFKSKWLIFVLMKKKEKGKIENKIKIKKAIGVKVRVVEIFETREDNCLFKYDGSGEVERIKS